MRVPFGITLAALLSLGAQALEAPIEGYGIEDFEWEIEHSPGQKFRARGTIEQVIHQARTLNPEYKPKEPTTQRRNARGSLLPLTRRYDEAHHICFPDGMGSADANKVYDPIKHLQGLDGKPTNGPGPGNCGQVSCSYNNAIWWCNDSTESKTLDSWSEIGDAASALCNDCWISAVASQNSFENLCGGQMFMKNDWNVIVRDGHCCLAIFHRSEGTECVASLVEIHSVLSTCYLKATRY